jgi:hypothetical protein
MSYETGEHPNDPDFQWWHVPLGLLQAVGVFALLGAAIVALGIILWILRQVI